MKPDRGQATWLLSFFDELAVSEQREEVSMPVVIGVALAWAVVLLARLAGFDRDRAFYPTVVIVVASYYVLFAVLSGSMHTVLGESVVMALFVGVAVTGFRSSAWIAMAALAGHGVFDAVHGHLLHNAGMPVWWPAFCGSFDLAAAAACVPHLTRGLPAHADKA